MKINNPETLIEFVASNELTFKDLNNILSKTIYSLFINDYSTNERVRLLKEFFSLYGYKLENRPLFIDESKQNNMSDLTRTDVIKLIAIATKPLNLQNVNLVGVDLSKLDLRGANLEGANLTGADLSGAKLSGAILRARSSSTVFVGMVRRFNIGIKFGF